MKKFNILVVVLSMFIFVSCSSLISLLRVDEQLAVYLPVFVGKTVEYTIAKYPDNAPGLWSSFNKVIIDILIPFVKGEGRGTDISFLKDWRNKSKPDGELGLLLDRVLSFLNILLDKAGVGATRRIPQDIKDRIVSVLDSTSLGITSIVSSSGHPIMMFEIVDIDALGIEYQAMFDEGVVILADAE